MPARTFFFIKPDAVKRGRWARVLDVVQGLGEVTSLEMITVDRDLAEEHYKSHAGRHNFDELIEFTISGPVIAGILEEQSWPVLGVTGEVLTIQQIDPTLDLVGRLRQLVGDAQDPGTGTIRSHYRDPNSPLCHNVIHASDSAEEAEREIALWFPEPTKSRNLDIADLIVNEARRLHLEQGQYEVGIGLRNTDSNESLYHRRGDLVDYDSNKIIIGSRTDIGSHLTVIYNYEVSSIEVVIKRGFGAQSNSDLNALEPGATVRAAGRVGVWNQ